MTIGYGDYTQKMNKNVCNQDRRVRVEQRRRRWTGNIDSKRESLPLYTKKLISEAFVFHFPAKRKDNFLYPRSIESVDDINETPFNESNSNDTFQIPAHWNARLVKT